MIDPIDSSEIDITGPAGETLFWHAKSWVTLEIESDLQAVLNETWRHYENIKDDRLLALVGALCIEEAVQSILVGMGAGFSNLEDDTNFTYSMKIKVARALQLLPGRILTSCDLIRIIRNAFAHDLSIKSFSDLNQKKILAKIEPNVRAFNNSTRDQSDYTKLFRELISSTLIALIVYSRHISKLREWLATPEAMKSFAQWSEAMEKS